MPTISVDKAALFKELGREYVHHRDDGISCAFLITSLREYRYTTEEFDELCFEFGRSR
jgi:hypothetical protein